MAADKNLFHNYRKIKGSVEVANGAIIEAIGIGDININAVVDNKIIPTVLRGVLHVPALAANLISQDQLVYGAHHSIIHTERSWLQIINKYGAVVGTTSRINRQQILNTTVDAAYSSSDGPNKK